MFIQTVRPYRVSCAAFQEPYSAADLYTSGMVLHQSLHEMYTDGFYLTTTKRKLVNVKLKLLFYTFVDYIMAYKLL